MEATATSALGFTAGAYSIRIPHEWSWDTSKPADRFSHIPWRGPAMVSIAARPLSPGTPAARWGVIVDSRYEASCAPHDYRRFVVDGAKIRISVYRDYGGSNVESASFVHRGLGYRVIWRGRVSPPERDYARFDALLQTIVFAR